MGSELVHYQDQMKTRAASRLLTVVDWGLKVDRIPQSWSFGESENRLDHLLTIGDLVEACRAIGRAVRRAV